MYSMGLTDSDRAILDEQERDARYDDDEREVCRACGGDGYVYDDLMGDGPCPYCDAGESVAADIAAADEAIPLPMLSDDEDDFADIPF